jgi:hypothetical protein
MAMKVPRQCPSVGPVKVGCRKVKVFGSGEGRHMKSGASFTRINFLILFKKLLVFTVR